ncbi:Protein PER1 [Grifola frondosa]|uniref:Post-GPI attachment to proteins factor 3 n=1 Tax=Grifola frondosa TaxID=5627 RepID=A0A1C7MDQ8_GRIFR|nr:Protein PER1 [Grifola frondosa]
MHLPALLRVCMASTLLTVAFASSGDRSGDFITCVSTCAQSTPLAGMSLAMRLTRWTHTDDCKYQCMHFITDQAIKYGRSIQQYHGKWPFWRFVGMQEPASVAFSLLNLLAHARGARDLQARIPDGHPMKKYYLAFAFVSINAWIWSSVFHTRGWQSASAQKLTSLITPPLDLPVTEKLDYFSAALAIIYALYYTVVRLFHIYSPERGRLTQRSSALSGVYLTWTCLCATTYLAHVTYLTILPRFDYTYNMAFNLVIGLAHNILWLAYSLPSSLPILRRFPSRPKTYRPQYAVKPAIFAALTTLATALELFDFPPWGRIIDAHSLWHLATAPIAVFWYDFLIQDALDEGWRDIKS